jgi:U1 small nuclear ribonucleoprotein
VYLNNDFFIDAVAKADGRRIENRKIIVDRELGRTRKDWLPRRLGGGKGDSRRDRKDEEIIRELKKDLDQEEKVLSKGQKLDKLQEKPIAAVKNE